ncbi:MAG: helix-turn-helix domain-containing protein, partial [Chlamydiota bacterium]|nr:helix-turn-helix domain-containing protein [Chlamydiota bacterium]
EGRFVEEVLNKTDERLQKQERMKAEGWDIDRVIKDVCVHFGIEQEELLSRRRTDRLSLARGVIAKICFDQLGISAQEVGKSLGVSRQAMFKGMEKGERYCRENHDKLTS